MGGGRQREPLYPHRGYSGPNKRGGRGAALSAPPRGGSRREQLPATRTLWVLGQQPGGVLGEWMVRLPGSPCAASFSMATAGPADCSSQRPLRSLPEDREATPHILMRMGPRCGGAQPTTTPGSARQARDGLELRFSCLQVQWLGAQC